MTSHHCPRCSTAVSASESETVYRVVGAFLSTEQVIRLGLTIAGTGTGVVDELCSKCLVTTAAESI